ncbi:MAG: alpha/beta fold hydrolase [Bacteroidales bacterium]
MKTEEQFLETGKQKIFLRTLLPDTTPRAIIQINHGMAEHSDRYLQFSDILVKNGFGVYLHDHPGHGKFISNKNELGIIPEKKGWDHMLNTIESIHEVIKKEHMGTPLIMMGHSMGSLLTRHYLAGQYSPPDGVIISGTNFPDPVLLRAGMLLVKGFRFFYPANHKSKRLNQFFYSNFNKKIPNAKTPFDWLSSNPKEVSKYKNDPFCGFDMPLGFYHNLFKGSLQLFRAEKNLKLETNTHYLIISGKDDPVGDFGNDPQKLYNLLKKQNGKQLQLVLLDGRHELLNEKPQIRKEFIRHIIDFTEQVSERK